MISKQQLIVKRSFDVLLSLILLSLIVIPLAVLVLISSIDTKLFGIFSQWRVGQYGQLFKIYKLRTLKQEPHRMGHLRKSASKIGAFFRKTKIDELPQLFNILKGDMSFVGPRPDVPGFADKLIGDDSIILRVKPGITGPATLKYRNEEVVLSQQIDPESYNKCVIWPDKIEINKKYVLNWSFYLDLTIIKNSLFSPE